VKRIHSCLALLLAGLLLSMPEAQAGANKYGMAHAKPQPRGTIRIATYNMLNLFDHVDDPSLQGEHDDISEATSDDRCRALAAAIREVDADIIACQEIESLDALTWFRDTYLKGMGYEYLASKDVGYYRGIECSVMSRFPITKIETYQDRVISDTPRPGPGWEAIPADERTTRQRYQRSPLRVDIKVSDEYELTVFSIHHKAGRYRWLREMEAATTVQILNRMMEENDARNIIVMGDFNAAPWDKSVRLYREAGFVDTLSHRVIPRWKDFDPAEPNLYKTHESDRVLDYILCSPAAYREVVPRSAHVVGTLYDAEYDWREDPFPKGYASDHYPVVIDLKPHDEK
jgi:endonuclease/exonuclease/phosphatase family metal-dependent hydrolase